MSKLLAIRGEAEEASRLSAYAIELALGTDNPNLRGNALMDASDVARHVGRIDESRKKIRQALSFYSQKGNLVSANRARRCLDELL